MLKLLYVGKGRVEILKLKEVPTVNSSVIIAGNPVNAPTSISFELKGSSASEPEQIREPMANKEIVSDSEILVSGMDSLNLLGSDTEEEEEDDDLENEEVEKLAKQKL